MISFLKVTCKENTLCMASSIENAQSCKNIQETVNRNIPEMWIQKHKGQVFSDDVILWMLSIMKLFLSQHFSYSCGRIYIFVICFSKEKVRNNRPIFLVWSRKPGKSVHCIDPNTKNNQKTTTPYQENSITNA